MLGLIRLDLVGLGWLGCRLGLIGLASIRFVLLPSHSLSSFIGVPVAIYYSLP